MTTPDPTPALLSTARLADYRSLLAKAPTVALTSSHGSIFPADEAEQQARFDRRLDPTILQAYGTTEEMYPWAEFFAAAPDMTRALLAHLDALTPRDREAGGRLVREVWIAWAREQPSPKPSWLVPWEGLSEPDREVDRRIFEACHAAGRASLTPRAVDGEALGRAARRARYESQGIGDAMERAAPWEKLAEDDRAVYVATGLALHAIGYAAGRSEGEAERAERDATIARLTAELAEARSEAHAAAEAMLAPKIELATMGLRAELAESRGFLLGAARAKLDLLAEVEAAEARADTARRDGAREEREAAEARAGIEPRHALSADNYPLCGTSIALYVTRQAEAVTCPTCARLAGAREERRLAILDMLTVARETHPSAQPAVHEAMRELGKLVNARGEGQGS